MSKPLFEKGKIYRLKHGISVVVRRFRNGNPSQSEQKDLSGNYEFMGCRGPRYHFFSNDLGKDLFLNKREAIAATQESEAQK